MYDVDDVEKIHCGSAYEYWVVAKTRLGHISAEPLKKWHHIIDKSLQSLTLILHFDIDISLTSTFLPTHTRSRYCDVTVMKI